jgi:hypothetical protein
MRQRSTLSSHMCCSLHWIGLPLKRQPYWTVTTLGSTAEMHTSCQTALAQQWCVIDAAFDIANLHKALTPLKHKH